MDMSKHDYRSDLTRQYVAQGYAEGRAQGHKEGRETGCTEGMLAIVTRQLEARFGALPEAVRVYMALAPSFLLGFIATDLLVARSLRDALGERIMDSPKDHLYRELERRYVEEGRIRGYAQGLEEARSLAQVQGMRMIVSWQLRTRFGRLPKDIHAQIDAATPPELEAIAEKLLTAESLQEAMSVLSIHALTSDAAERELS